MQTTTITCSPDVDLEVIKLITRRIYAALNDHETEVVYKQDEKLAEKTIQITSDRHVDEPIVNQPDGRLLRKQFLIRGLICEFPVGGHTYTYSQQ